MVILGRLNTTQLTPLAGAPNMQAANSTAAMFERLRREAIRTDRSIFVVSPGGAYRNLDDLVDIQRQWLGKSHRKNWNLNPGSGAMPSLSSVHGLGRCLDFGGDVQWVHQMGPEYGLTFPLVYLGDRNHGEHDGVTRGQSDLYGYEIKRLARYLHARTKIDIGAAESGHRGPRTTHFWKALRQVVAHDHRQGASLRSHYTQYLDLEARAAAPTGRR